MQFTHTEARRLVQFELDTELSPEQKTHLAEHLKHCGECHSYAQDMQRIASALLQMNTRARPPRPLPLSIRELAGKIHQKRHSRTLLVMRTSLIALIFAAVAFNAWHYFSVSELPTSSPAPMGILPAPTPSTPSTSTRISMENCELILYSVHEQDTLASLARQFSVSREEISALNHLRTEVIPGTRIWIPLCHLTPTGTLDGTTALTGTYTPAFRPTTSTPDG